MDTIVSIAVIICMIINVTLFFRRNREKRVIDISIITDIKNLEMNIEGLRKQFEKHIYTEEKIYNDPDRSND